METHAGTITGIIAAIGNTPLIKLKRASEAARCTILGKAEFMNPGQSVKDRAALFIIDDAVNKACCSPAASSLRAPPAIPASVSRSSATLRASAA
jgi:threonine dehydratase